MFPMEVCGSEYALIIMISFLLYVITVLQCPPDGQTGQRGSSSEKSSEVLVLGFSRKNRTNGI